MEKIKDMVFFANENTEGVKLSSALPLLMTAIPRNILPYEA